MTLKEEIEEQLKHFGQITHVHNTSNAILSAIKAKLPEKDTMIKNEKGAGVDQFNDYTNGYNQALTDVIKALGL